MSGVLPPREPECESWFDFGGDFVTFVNNENSYRDLEGRVLPAFRSFEALNCFRYGINFLGSVRSAPQAEGLPCLQFFGTQAEKDATIAKLYADKYLCEAAILRLVHRDRLLDNLRDVIRVEDQEVFNFQWGLIWDNRDTLMFPQIDLAWLARLKSSRDQVGIANVPAEIMWSALNVLASMTYENNQRWAWYNVHLIKVENLLWSFDGMPDELRSGTLEELHQFL